MMVEETSSLRWEDFTKWLRNKNVAIVKDFDSDYEWRWLTGEEREKLHENTWCIEK